MTNKPLLKLIFLIIFSMFFLTNIHAQIPDSQRQALIDFYQTTNGDNWTNNEGWNGEVGTECSWFGITCDDEENIKWIELEENNLSGEIPSSIKNFPGLMTLKLQENNLTSIPHEIGELGKITFLALSNNQFDNVPNSIGNLNKLDYLYLSYNQLTSIPSEVGNLLELKRFFLNNNQLRSRQKINCHFLHPTSGHICRV